MAHERGWEVLERPYRENDTSASTRSRTKRPVFETACSTAATTSGKATGSDPLSPRAPGSRRLTLCSPTPTSGLRFVQPLTGSSSYRTRGAVPRPVSPGRSVRRYSTTACNCTGTHLCAEQPRRSHRQKSAVLLLAVLLMAGVAF